MYNYSAQCVRPFCQQSCSGIGTLTVIYYLNISVSVTIFVLNNIKFDVSAHIIVSNMHNLGYCIRILQHNINSTKYSCSVLYTSFLSIITFTPVQLQISLCICY